MVANPLIGVLFHWLGGLAAGSFYAPFKVVRNWAWEVYWLVGGIFSWIIVPWIVALIMIPNLGVVLGEQSLSTLGWTYFWGVLWGFGGLTFGLSMRYLGMSLGYAIIMGYSALFGTYIPPLINGTLANNLITVPGQIILIGMFLCLIGIMIAGSAGFSKEKELGTEQKQKSVKEFNFKKGILVATFSGIMSSCFAYGLAAGEPLSAAAFQNGADRIWTGLPKLIIVMAGGFTTNLIWCLYLLIKNKTLYQFTRIEGSGKNNAQLSFENVFSDNKSNFLRFLTNYSLSALAGTIWYFQFFFYTMGETQMGNYQFSSWTIHMASIIIFSSLWGIYLKEWKSTSSLTKFLLGLALLTLIISTLIIGYANLLDIRLA